MHAAWPLNKVQHFSFQKMSRFRDIGTFNCLTFGPFLEMFGTTYFPQMNNYTSRYRHYIIQFLEIDCITSKSSPMTPLGF